MARPISGNAMTSAERKVALRIRRAERGETRHSVELTAEAADKADLAAEAQGLNRAAIVNALILRELP